MILELIILAVTLLISIKVFIMATCGRYQVPDCSGKVYVVTGASSGIGLETCRALLKQGGTVYMANRSQEKTDQALIDIEKTVPEARSRSHYINCDLSDFSTVRQCAQELKQLEKIDVFINNAGLAVNEYRKTKDGFETTWQTNHLGPFLLTNLVMDKLIQSHSRIVNVSSLAHKGGSMANFEAKMTDQAAFSAIRAYNDTKLANILFTRELSRRFSDKGITTNALHPGAVQTSLFREAPRFLKPMLKLMSPFFKTAQDGAATTLYLATSPDVASKSGGYYADCREASVTSGARDEEMAKKLWAASEKAVGLSTAGQGGADGVVA